MAITYVASATSDGSSSTSRSVSDPAGTQENDFYVAVCSILDDAGAGAWSTPAGWTKVAENHYATAGNSDLITAVFYRLRGASAVGSTEFSSTSAANFIAVTISAYRGVDTTTPLDVSYANASHYAQHLNNPTAANSAITTATDGAVALLIWTGNGANTGGTAGAPSGYTLDLNFNANTHNGRFLASKTVATAGTETPGVWTHTSFAANADTQLYTLALRPEAEAPAALYPASEPLYYLGNLLVNKTAIKASITAGYDGLDGDVLAAYTNATTNGSGILQLPLAVTGTASQEVFLHLYWEEGSAPVVDRSLIVKTTLVAA